jgi:hypothetical protein
VRLAWRAFEAVDDLGWLVVFRYGRRHLAIPSRVFSDDAAVSASRLRPEVPKPSQTNNPFRHYASGRVCGPHTTLNFRTTFPLNHSDIVLALQIQPKLRAVAEITTEAHGGVGGNRPPAV